MKTTVVLTVVTGAIVAASATARPLAAPSRASESLYCATREAGNPHSRLCDYIAWSGWRRRGGWDATLDTASLMNPRFVPNECNGPF